MAERTTVDRRTVLQTIGSSTAAGVALTASVGATEEPPLESAGTESDCDDIPSVPEEAASPPQSYVSTVDRVVDGEHVVILLEDGTRTVGQIVVPSSEYPCLEEGDRIVATVDGDDLACYRWLEE